MTRKARRKYSSRFKAKVAILAVRGDKSLVDLAAEYDVHRNQIQGWRDRLINGAEQLFERRSKHSIEAADAKIQELHAKIGELTMERENHVLAGDKGRDPKPWRDR